MYSKTPQKFDRLHGFILQIILNQTFQYDFVYFMNDNIQFIFEVLKEEIYDAFAKISE